MIDDVDEVLTTTRSVRRRMDFDRPVEPEVIEECLRIAQQATVGSNNEHWRFVVVRDLHQRERIAELYRDVWEQTVARPLRERQPATVRRLDPAERGSDEEQARQQRVLDSVKYLVDRLDRVPVLVLACSVSPPPREPLGHHASGYYGSIIPAVWSFQLALRSRGLGSVLATAAVYHAEGLKEVLELPEEFVPICLVPVAYTQGLEFKVVKRRPLEEIMRYDRWGTS